MSGYGLETGTAAELRQALTITLTLTDTGFAVLALLLGYKRHSPDPNAVSMLRRVRNCRFIIIIVIIMYVI